MFLSQALLEIVQIQFAMATWKEVLGVTTANLNVCHVEESGVQMVAQRLLHPTQLLHRHLLPELLPRAWQRLQGNHDLLSSFIKVTGTRVIVLLTFISFSLLGTGIAVEEHAAVLTSPSKAMIQDQLIVIGKFNEWSAMHFTKNTGIAQ